MTGTRSSPTGQRLELRHVDRSDASQLPTGPQVASGCERRARRPRTDLQGREFGALTVLRAEGTKWVARCQCGNEIRSQAFWLLKGQRVSCADLACPHRKLAWCRSHGGDDLTGCLFGRLTVLGLAPHRPKTPRGSSVLWRCRCSCGREVDRHSGDLVRSVETAFCGHCNARILMPGARFDRLTVRTVSGDAASRAQTALCDCDCGGTIERTTKQLYDAKRALSCGCGYRERKRELAPQYEYQGARRTLLEIANMVGVVRGTLQRQLNRLGSIEEAVSAAVAARRLPANRYPLFGVLVSLADLKALSGLKGCTIMYRIRSGLPPEDAIKPLMRSRPTARDLATNPIDH